MIDVEKLLRSCTILERLRPFSLTKKGSSLPRSVIKTTMKFTDPVKTAKSKKKKQEEVIITACMVIASIRHSDKAYGN